MHTTNDAIFTLRRGLLRGGMGVNAKPTSSKALPMLRGSIRMILCTPGHQSITLREATLPARILTGNPEETALGKAAALVLLLPLVRPWLNNLLSIISLLRRETIVS